MHADHHAIVFSPSYSSDHTVYVTNDGGVWKTTNPNGGTSTSICASSIGIAWESLNDGYNTLQFYHGAVSATQLVGGCQDNGSWKYDHAGTAWEQIAGGDGGWAAAEPNSNRVYRLLL